VAEVVLLALVVLDGVDVAVVVLLAVVIVLADVVELIIVDVVPAPVVVLLALVVVLSGVGLVGLVGPAGVVVRLSTGCWPAVCANQA
jgi:hypothetical protein